MKTLRRLHTGAAWDTALAFALLGVGLSQVWAGWHDGGIGALPSGHEWARSAAVVVFGAPLVCRRRWPLGVVLVVCAAIVVQLLAITPYVPFVAGLVPMAVANYTAAAYARRWRPASLLAVLVTEAIIYARIAEERTGGEVLFALFVAIGTWVAGDVVRARAVHAERTLGQAHALVAETDAATTVAVAEERARIARELHDVIAHSVSVMGVQAGAARTLIDRDPEAARAALLSVEATARSSVAELQRLLAVLRDDDASDDSRSPQPGLEQLEALVQHFRAAGLPVDLTMSNAASLPPGLDLTAYRIVQEALTNALKHAGTPTRVSIERRDGALHIEVRDGGSTGRIRVQRSGARHGLIGMRERVQLYHGQLVAHAEQGGFVVRASLPLAADHTMEPVA